MLMTALSACIGLVPAAFSTGIGSQVQKPLATVVVGGMLIGPILLLAVVPALQLMFARPNPDDDVEEDDDVAPTLPLKEGPEGDPGLDGSSG